MLSTSTRPDGEMGGYSLGLNAPVSDGEDQWFGHGGAWGTNCTINWHKKQLKLWVVQINGEQPWNEDIRKAAEKFFNDSLKNDRTGEYTGRIK